MEDVQSYRKTVDRFAAIADSLVAVFALIMAWICSVAFNRPIKEMYGSIRELHMVIHMMKIRVNILK